MKNEKLRINSQLGVKELTYMLRERIKNEKRRINSQLGEKELIQILA